MLLSRETVEGLYITGKCTRIFFLMHSEMAYVFSEIICGAVQEASCQY